MVNEMQVLKKTTKVSIFSIMLLWVCFTQSSYAQCGDGPCKVCNVSATITNVIGGTIDNGTSSISGSISGASSGTASTPLEITATGCGEIYVEVELEFWWDQGDNVNWIHGVSFDNSAGWGAAQGIIIPADPGWLFRNTVTGVCSGTTYDAGYYWDPPGTSCLISGNLSSLELSGNCTTNIGPEQCEDDFGTNLVDGDPSDNWGIDCTHDCPKFGFNLDFCPTVSGDNLETISFYLTEDGETGGWSHSDNCIFLINFPIQINNAGLQLPDAIGPVCEGTCTTLDVGLGCSTYLWSTGETTQSIDVCPTTTTTYSVTVTSATGCQVEGSTTVTVEPCCAPDAGDLSANPNPTCPGNFININVSNYNTDTDYEQLILIVEPDGTISDIINGDSHSIMRDSCISLSVYSYNYNTTSSAFVPTIGSNISSIDCSVDCCELQMLTISWEDNENPVLLNPPANETLDCIDDLDPMGNLNWTDNCDGTGSVSGVESGSLDNCTGGSITRTWEYSDSCGNTASHTQTITLNPIPEPSFINPPADMTVSCNNSSGGGGILSYSNGVTGACQISGSVFPTESGTSDMCGGSKIFTWEYTDICGRTIMHAQTITIDPASEPAFVNPPADITVNCNAIPSGGSNLVYTNNESGNCLIVGIVSPVQGGFADACGGTITYTWEVTDPCLRTITHVQTITVEPAPEPAFVNPPADMTVSCTNIPTGATNLGYTNGMIGACSIAGFANPVQSGNADQCGGNITYTWEFTDNCGRTISHNQNITVDPAPEASFINPPADMTVDCSNIPSGAPNLNYTNNSSGACLIDGSVAPTTSGSADQCGGSITYTWEFTDPCGNTISHNQTITVDPIPEASFINPPADMTVDCSNIPSGAPNLDYSNGGSGACLIDGSVAPTTSGSADQCGGSITYTWEFTDPCGNTISHNQTITVDPIPEASFINPPADMTVDCSNIPSGAPNLDYSNFGSGACLLDGSVAPTTSGSADQCGGSITYTWEFTDPCGNTISHNQTITVDPIPEASFINPPADMTVDCSNIPSGAPNLDYSNGGSGACLIDGSVAPTTSGSADQCGGSITYTWEFTDPCGNTISHNQTITVDPIPEASFINPPADITVDCSNIPSGAPNLDYSNFGSGACLLNGSVAPTTSGSADQCGGSITYTWEFTDPCGNTISHNQTITVDPIPEASFINPPADMTVDCSNIPSGAPNLDYSNFGSGACLLDGSVAPTTSGSADQCGGSITYTWEFTDPCGNTISHNQTITVDPIPEASFINPPADLTVDCSNIPSGAPNLDYSNFGSGACLLDGSVAPTTSGSADQCGGAITFTWEFTDACGRMISHNQTVTVDPAPPAAFINPPADVTVSCVSSISSAPDLNYSNNGSGNCLIDGIASPTTNGTADECGGTITNTWQFVDPCGNITTHTQVIEVEPATAPIFLNPPSDITVSCDQIPTGGSDLDFSNSSTGGCLIEGTVSPVMQGQADECGGLFSLTWSFANTCHQITHVQNITVEPADPAAFINAPVDMTVSCADFSNLSPDLDYSNNANGACLIAGTVSPSQTGNVDICGGIITNEWEFVDQCGRIINHTQTITVDPAPPAVFDNLPADMTVTCTNVPASGNSLSYSNGESGICEISGSVAPIQSGSFDQCGGQITYTWTFTDDCNRVITHSQILTVEPAENPAFINPPVDISIACGGVVPDPDTLFYANSDSGPCEISGFVLADVDINGNITTYTWTFTHPCTNAEISHTQVITESISPDITLDPTSIEICEGDTYDLNLINVVDLNGTNPTITFHSSSPANSGNILGNTNVSPLSTTTYYILATSADDCTDEEPFTINVSPTVDAGQDIAESICFADAGNVDLISFLDPGLDPNGNWVDLNGSGVILIDPANVNFNNFDPGLFSIGYILIGNPPCPNDTAIFNITTLPEPEITLDSISCTSNLNFYDVFFQSNGYSISSSDGTVIELSPGSFVVQDIPIGSSVTITITDEVNDCSSSVSFNPPNCDCPDVDSPQSQGDEVICEGDPIPPLTVTVSPGTIANWYDSPIGGTLLANNTLSYTPGVSNVGTYTYYIEAQDSQFPDCVSQRIEITLTINPKPSANDAILEMCDDDFDGIVDFELNASVSSVNPNTGLSFDFYASMDDAINQVNSLPIIYQNTTPYQQEIFVVVSNGFLCSQIASVTLIVLELPNLSVEPVGETCLGNSDGQLIIHGSLSYSGLQFSLDQNTWQSDTVFTNLGSASHTLYVLTEDDCALEIPFDIVEGLELEIINWEVTCFDNGTGTDPSDDYYEITFEINNNLNQAGMFTLMDGNIPVGMYDYGTSYIYTIPADGAIHDLIFIDNVHACEISQSVGPLTSCSTNCELTIDLLTWECNDNGTPSDNSDDIYEITINASAVNGSSNNTYNVLIDNVLSFNFSYGENESFTLAADGNSPLITIVDNEDDQCQVTELIGPLDHCSNLCDINIETLIIFCNGNGTPGDPTDDFYEVTINVSGLNVSNTYEVFIDGSNDYTFAYDQDETFTLPADGSSPLVEVKDTNDPTCVDSQSIGPLDSCSDQCDIQIVSLEYECDDNGTVTNSDDDFYIVTIEVSAVNGSTSNSYELFVDANSQGLFNYGAVSQFNINADGLVHTIEVVDADNAGCVASQVIGPLTACSTTCEINLDQLEWECDDNNTPLDPSDDFYNITISASAVNGSLGNTYNVSINNAFYATYFYNDLNSFTLPADGALVTISVVDSEDDQCSTSQNIGLLVPCSDECVVAVNILDIICHDNETIDLVEDDYFTVMFEVSGINTSDSFTINSIGFSGAYDSIYEIGPFDIQDGNFILSFVDLIDTDCSVQINIEAPSPCSFPCAMEMVSIDIGECQDNGTGNTSDDDFFSVSFVVDSLEGTAVNFYAHDGQTNHGPFQYGEMVVLGNYKADGSVIIITCTDANNPNCSISFEISQNPCSSCDQILDAGIDVTLDCDVSSVTLNGQSSEIGIFNWTGPNNFNETGLGVMVSAPGVYYLHATYSDGCEAMDSVQVYQDDEVPTADAGPDYTLTCEIDEVLLTGISNVSGLGIGYEWTNELSQIISQTTTLVVNEPGTYYFQVFDNSNNCKSVIDAVVVSQDIDQPSAAIIADPGKQLDCVVESIVLSYAAEINLVYTWNWDNNSSSDPTLEVSSAGTYELHVIDTSNGCVNTAIIVIDDIEEYPIVNINPVPNLDCANEEVSINAAGSQTGTNIIYNWYDQNQSLIQSGNALNLVINTEGWYYLEVVDTLNGCANIDSVEVGTLINYPSISTEDEIHLECGITQTQISANITDLETEFSVYWEAISGSILGNPNNLTIEIEGPGTFVIHVLNEISQCPRTDTVNVYTNEDIPELAIFEIDSISCMGEQDGVFDLMSIVGGSPPYQTSLDGGEFTDMMLFTGLSAGQHSVVIIDANGCTLDTTFFLNEGIEIHITLDPHLSLYYFETGLLSATIDIPEDQISSIQWTPAENVSCPNCLETEVNPEEEGIYTITIEDINGCSATADIRIELRPDIQVFVPNVISPNSFIDENNKLTLYSNESVLLINKVEVFDRWGNRVFENYNFPPNDPSFGWDGTFKGKPMNPAVFVYQFHVSIIDGSTRVFAGDVTVVR